MALDITDTEFDEKVLSSNLPVMVDFWAPWCGPCKTLGPLIETIAEKTEGLAQVYKLNVDQFSEKAAEYGVRGVPTVIVFQGGQEAKRLVGLNPPEAYLEALDLEIEED